MKILMFGWEFPPHISGGLGTACAGLTRALEKAGAEVLFVIPKLRGDEQPSGTTFINASSIPIWHGGFIRRESAPTENTLRRNVVGEPYSTHITTRRKDRLTLLEVPSALRPYGNPVHRGTGYGLEKWNYSLEPLANQTTPASPALEKASKFSFDSVRASHTQEPYPFTGAYGPSLLEEVTYYSLVAAEIARDHSFDVIHAHDWMTYPAGIAARNISGKPLIIHVHATEIDRSGVDVNRDVFAIEKEGMQSADKVVAVSNWTKNIAVKHYGIDAQKIAVVHNGIAPRANQNKSATGPPIEAPIVTFLGRITYQKGPLFFVEAAKKVHEKFPDVHFVVAGCGDQLPRMVERSAQLRLSACFHFTGFVTGNDVDRIWAMSNVYVMPSVSEPFGIAPLEAIQAGVPVILSKQAGVSEVMPHAIKVDFWDSDALAEAICSLIRFKSLALTLKKNGARHIRGITWNQAAKKLTTLYYELTTSHERREKPDPLLPGSPAQKVTDIAFF